MPLPFSMDNPAAEDTGTPGRSIPGHPSPPVSPLPRVAPSPAPPGTRTTIGLQKMLAEYRAADVARAGAVGSDSARMLQKRLAKANVKQAKYKAAVAKDRKVAAAVRAAAKAASKSKSEERCTTNGSAGKGRRGHEHPRQ